MKKSFLFPLLALGLAGGASALDWGLTVNEAPLAIFGQTKLYIEAVKAKPWLTQPLFGSTLRLEGDISYSTSAPDLSNWKAGTVTFDLTEASVRGLLPLAGGAGVMEWDLGRRMATDLTGGMILFSRWDGFAASYFTGHSKVSGSVGYSGLLLKKTSKVVVSPADAAETADEEVKFAPQRIYGSTGFAYTEALWRQDVQFELLGDLDLRQGDDALHGVYATVATSGPLPGGLRQRLYATVSGRITPDAVTRAYLAGAEWSATLPFAGSRLVAGSVWSKGQGDYGFQSISGKGSADAITLPYYNTASGTVDFSFRPAGKTTVGAKTSVLFRTTDAPVPFSEASGYATTGEGAWLGAEVGAYGSWTPTSDLSFGVTSSMFIPNGSVFDDGSKFTALAVVTMTLKL